MYITLSRAGYTLLVHPRESPISSDARIVPNHSGPFARTFASLFHLQITRLTLHKPVIRASLWIVCSRLNETPYIMLNCALFAAGSYRKQASHTALSIKNNCTGAFWNWKPGLANSHSWFTRQYVGCVEIGTPGVNDYLRIWYHFWFTDYANSKGKVCRYLIGYLGH